MARYRVAGCGWPPPVRRSVSSSRTLAASVFSFLPAIPSIDLASNRTCEIPEDERKSLKSIWHGLLPFQQRRSRYDQLSRFNGNNNRSTAIKTLIRTVSSCSWRRHCFNALGGNESPSTSPLPAMAAVVWLRAASMPVSLLHQHLCRVHLMFRPGHPLSRVPTTSNPVRFAFLTGLVCFFLGRVASCRRK